MARASRSSPVRRLLQDYLGCEAVQEQEEVVAYLTSVARDEDTSTGDFAEALCGFFPDLPSESAKLQGAAALAMLQVRLPGEEEDEDGAESDGGMGKPGDVSRVAAPSSCCQPAPSPPSAPSAPTPEPTSFTAPGALEGAWSCPVCTFFNDELMPSCEMCGGPSPRFPPTLAVSLAKPPEDQGNGSISGGGSAGKGGGQRASQKSRRRNKQTLLVSSPCSSGGGGGPAATSEEAEAARLAALEAAQLAEAMTKSLPDDELTSFLLDAKVPKGAAPPFFLLWL